MENKEIESQIPSLDFDKEAAPLPTLDELTVLKERAKKLNISFSPNIGLEALKAKVQAVLDNTASAKDVSDAPTENKPAVVAPVLVETDGQRRSRLRKEAHKLIRVRISCKNQNKKEWPGEIFTVSNSVIGTIRKFVPFDAEDGYHVPKALLQMIKEREHQVFYKVKENGKEVTRSKLQREFHVEILDPLTQAELAELAQRQAITRSVE